jgi:hypothetical protein
MNYAVKGKIKWMTYSARVLSITWAICWMLFMPVSGAGSLFITSWRSRN